MATPTPPPADDAERTHRAAINSAVFWLTISAVIAMVVYVAIEVA